MAQYNNPNNMFPDNEWHPSGAVGGWLGGIQMAYSMANAQNQLQAGDIDNSLSRLKLQNESEELPVNRLKRQLAGQTVQSDVDMMNQNPEMVAQWRKAKPETDIQNAEQEKQKTYSMQRDIIGKTYTDLDKQIQDILNDNVDKATGEQPKGLNTLPYQKWWEQQAQHLTSLGVKNVPTEFGPQVIDSVRRNAQGYVAAQSSVDIAKNDPKNAVKMAVAAIGEHGREYTADRRLEGTRYTADKSLEAAQARISAVAASRGNSPGALTAEIMRDVNSGDPERINKWAPQMIEDARAVYKNAADAKNVPALVNNIQNPKAAEAANKAETQSIIDYSRNKNGSSAAPKAPVGRSMSTEEAKAFGKTAPEGTKQIIDGKSYTLTVKDGQRGWMAD